jgi:hypothetical protein
MYFGTIITVQEVTWDMVYTEVTEECGPETLAILKQHTPPTSRLGLHILSKSYYIDYRQQLNN